MLIAPLKPNGLPRPVQIPDMFRAIVTSYAVAKVFKSKEAINFIETGAGRTDPRYYQRPKMVVPTWLRKLNDF